MHSSRPTRARCPECGKPTTVDYRPFCSRRCADLDLGKWFGGAYVLPGEREAADPADSDGDEG
ncbi:DNA gyrase inhibitor YacG [Yunchengibacter salinarum]|uniref:DNA gyrase inhibitor YacG n=1 Tax=Yunchengibacter salinarum TaxID=3133399 RepID=UPI0035B66327